MRCYVTFSKVFSPFYEGKQKSSKTSLEIMNCGCKLRSLCATEPFIFLYVASFGIHFSMLPQLIIAKICSQNYNETVCSSLKLDRYKSEETRVYKDATTWNTVVFVCTIVPSLIFILPFGTLSDLVSKKKLLIVPPLALILQSGTYLLSAVFRSSNLAFLALGASLTGIFGDVQGALALGNSYMADVTKPGSNRVIRMIILGGLTYTGTGFGAYFSGLLLSNFGFVSAFLMSCVMSIVNLAYVMFILPRPGVVEPYEIKMPADETVLKEGGSKTGEVTFENEGRGGAAKDENEASDLIRKSRHYAVSTFFASISKYTKSSFQNIAVFMKKYHSLPRGKFVWLLLAVYSLAGAANCAESTVIVLFITHSPLSLNSSQVGTYLFLLMLTRGFGAVILGIFMKFFQPDGTSLIVFGFISYILTFATMAFSTKMITLYGFSAFSIAFPLTLSGIRAVITKKVDSDENGTVLSLCGFIGVAADTVLAITANLLFKWTSHFFPGLSILCLAIFSFFGFVVMLGFICLDKRSNGNCYENIDKVIN